MADWGAALQRRTGASPGGEEVYVFQQCTLVMMEAGLVLGSNRVWFWAPHVNKTDDKLER